MTEAPLRYANEEQDEEEYEKPEQVSRLLQFTAYRERLEKQRTVLLNLETRDTILVVKPSDASRYFEEGRRRIKAKIYKQLGSWGNVPGILWGMTYDPTRTTLEDAWKNVGKDRRLFLNNLDRWRARHKCAKLKYLCVIEVQKQTGYPHVHVVFPNLNWIAPFDVAQDCWGKGMCFYTKRDGFSPTAYICKYITKLEGWDDDSLSEIWLNRTRLYSMSNDYRLPDYAEKRVPRWAFIATMTRFDVEMRHPKLIPEEEISDTGGQMWS